MPQGRGNQRELEKGEGEEEVRNGRERKERSQYATQEQPKGTLKGGGEEVRNGRGKNEQSQYATQGHPKGTFKGGGVEVRNGRGRKEQSQYATQGQPKGILKEGGGSEKRKREKGAVTVCHTGATKGNFKKGRRK